MKVLVTGGAGFIGSNFVRFALDKGADIINVDKLTYAGNLENLGSYNQHAKHHFCKADICCAASIQQIISQYQPDSIIHMAAESHVDRSIDCADDFIQTNIVGTYTLLSNAFSYFNSLPAPQKAAFRFIHLSTDEVFGALGNTGKFTELSPYQPNSPYAASKASSDLLVRSYYKTYKFPAIIVNASNNYGPRQFPEKLIPLTILNALENKPLPIYGNGRQIRDWLYVEDHVQALWDVLHHGKIGEQYCIGSDNEISNLEVVHEICDVLDRLHPSQHVKKYKDLITFVKDRPGHDFRYATDATKVKKHTSWVPKTSFTKGLERTIKWYVDHQKNLLQIDARHRIGLRGNSRHADEM